MSSLQKPRTAARSAVDVAGRTGGSAADAAIHVADPRSVSAAANAERRATARMTGVATADAPLAGRGRSRIGRVPSRRQTDAPPLPLVWPRLKRGIDCIGAGLLLLLLSPLFALLYVQIRREGGDVFYGHRRIGRNGEWFTCYKFRTMIPDAEAVLQRVLAENPALQAEWDRDEKLRDDPRVTAVGNWLRRTSLDELPQLYNVLIGDMSLVGPRPATEIGKSHYGRAWRWYQAVRPGMTGLWQVSGRNEVGFRRRVALDVYYIRNQSLLLDLQILLRTIRVVAGCTGY